MERQVIVYINTEQEFYQLRKTAPQMPLMVSLPDQVKDTGSLKIFLQKTRVELLDGDWKDYNPEIVKLANSLGCAVIPDIQQPLENPALWDAALAKGFEGLQTDHPSALIAYLKRKKIKTMNKTRTINGWALFLLMMLSYSRASAQSHNTENVIIVTLDGMRWQEVFGGVDSALVRDKRFTRDSAEMVTKFWSNDISERRKKLFPFLWTTVLRQGQLYGNRNDGSEVNNANPYKFSYPGYNEIFTGYPDTAVNSNDKILNRNTNVLEYINRQKGFTGKVAVFSTWDVFPYILNKWRSGIYVNADVDSLNPDSRELKLINDMQFLSTRPIGVRPDIFTYFAGREYLKANKPRVLYIAFDETDDFAHAGEYDQYIGSAHAEDAMLADLWSTVQSMPEYRNKTTLIVTCDHGRGDKIKEQWRDHGQNIEDAGHIWIAVLGPDTRPMGEVKTTTPLYQKQLAPTIAALLGLHFIPDHEKSDPISSIVKY